MEKSIVSDAFHYKGAPADRAKTGGWVSAAMILCIEICERLSTLGIAVNMVTYLVGTMHIPSATASVIVGYLSGSSFLLCLLDGCIADSFLVWVLAFWPTLPNLRPPPSNPALGVKCEEASTLQMAIFYIAMYTFGVGVCGVKSRVLFSTRKKKLKWHTSTDSTSSSALEPYWPLQRLFTLKMM